MKISLLKPFASNGKADEFDVRQMKKALNRLGYYHPYDATGITGTADRAVFDALRSFQSDHGLPATGAAKPDDETLTALNAAIENAPDGAYIWRTAGDDRVRDGHAALNGTKRKWSDDPDPGQDFGCRCWADDVEEGSWNEEYPDAILPTLGPFDLLLGGVFVKGGVQLSATTLHFLRQTLKREIRVNAPQGKNLARFIGKIPSNSKGSVKITKLPGGNVKFTAVSQGRVPGSKAVYEKVVDPSGKTIQYTKTTYVNGNKILHIKDKLGKGKFHE
ncbi:peptidoglycan-binding protein [Micavibrio aeruginosavorus]|uniref:peptidoglycan-binding protein n=1 Tax=Micavibrio aeruginosavorus TaxID=349221 RepID=UPI000318202A|nr:peptidoglycan-binding protein [Micavibrio aeruginosavorus]